MVANLRSRGWGVGQAEAIAELETRETALAVAAAERAHSDRGMSDKARAEADAFDETVADHVGAIPDTPIVRRKHRASTWPLPPSPQPVSLRRRLTAWGSTTSVSKPRPRIFQMGCDD
jgi:hypothetical protein